MIGGGCEAAPPRAMKTLSWNCQRLGNPRTVQALYLLVSEKQLDIIFLMETRLKVSRATVLLRRLAFEGCVGVDSRGQSGDLLVMWRNEEMAELVNFSQRHINVSIDEG